MYWQHRMRIKITNYWYTSSLHFFTCLLLPFSWLFRLSVFLRRCFYRLGLLTTQRFDVPIIIVGNITVGGTGKTPFIMWLAHFLQQQGFHPGIVSRGVGGQLHRKPHAVQTTDTVKKVGDEALLLLEKTHCPVVICRNRPAAVQHLLQHTSCNIIISDDGLQHYALDRDIEIAIVDETRRFGNQQLLPAGPLREPVKRLRQVDFVIVNGKQTNDPFVMTLQPTQFVSLVNPQHTLPFTGFLSPTCHAIAGIGHPERFFATLRQANLNIIAHPFKDHHLYQPHDIPFQDNWPIVMTEKDAIKCRHFADERYWALSIDTHITETFQALLLEKVLAKMSKV